MMHEFDQSHKKYDLISSLGFAHLGILDEYK